jgi:hypothetical protein
MAQYEVNVECTDIKVKDIQDMITKMRDKAHLRQVDLDNATVGALEALDDNQRKFEQQSSVVCKW